MLAPLYSMGFVCQFSHMENHGHIAVEMVAPDIREHARTGTVGSPDDMTSVGEPPLQPTVGLGT